MPYPVATLTNQYQPYDSDIHFSHQSLVVVIVSGVQIGISQFSVGLKLAWKSIGFDVLHSFFKVF